MCSRLGAPLVAMFSDANKIILEIRAHVPRTALVPAKFASFGFDEFQHRGRVMNLRHVLLSAPVAICLAVPGHAADPVNGKEIAQTVCAACHGANGVSVSPGVPNLAAQRAGYIVKQLKDYRSEKRKHGIMSGLVGSLSDATFEDVAAYFASLPGAPDGAAKSKPPANYIAKRVALPSDLLGFTHYYTFNHQGRKQLRNVYANKVAMDAARAGKDLPDGSVLVVEAFAAEIGADKKPVVGADGFYVASGRAGYTAMERRSGWGQDFPGMIRNGDWQYGVFKADGSPRPNVNQASCLSCHLPHAKNSYVFTLKQLRDAAGK
jgi:cytochrome c553